MGRARGARVDNQRADVWAAVLLRELRRADAAHTLGLPRARPSHNRHRRPPPRRQRAALAGSSPRRSWPLHGQAAHGGRWAGGDLDVRAEAEERKDNVCVTVARREVQGREPLLVLCADRRAKVGELRYCARRASRRGRMQRCLLEEVKRIQRCVLSDQEPVRALARQAISSLTSAAGGAGPRAELAGQGALSVC